MKLKLIFSLLISMLLFYKVYSVYNNDNDCNSVGDLVVIGDVHGCSQCLKQTLFKNGITNNDGLWIAGNRTVVQLGDIVGRGPDDLRVIKYIQQIELEAEQVNGKWIQLVGNHEDMELNGDYRYANDGPYGMYNDGSPAGSGFGNIDARIKQLGANGEIGKWLRQKPIIYKWNDIVMVHGGISSKEIAELGVDKINQEFWNGNTEVANHILWDRSLSLGEESVTCDILESILNELNANRMVVGHTITSFIKPGYIVVKCNEKMILTDVGMSSAFPSIPKYFKAAHFFKTDNNTTIYKY